MITCAGRITKEVVFDKHFFAQISHSQKVGKIWIYEYENKIQKLSQDGFKTIQFLLIKLNWAYIFLFLLLK